MIKKIFILAIIFPLVIMGQDQGIELPDFVITGVKKVSIPTVKKRKAELFSTLSKDFILPKKSPADFKLLELTKPEVKDTNFIKSGYVNNADLFLGAGINSLPVGDFNLSLNSNHYLFSTKVFGLAEKDYVENSDYNISGVKLNNDFFISSASNFLAGAKISLFGSYVRDDYKLFGNLISDKKRERRNLTFGIGIKEYVYSNFKFGIKLLNEYFSMPDDFDLKENNLSLRGNLDFGIKQFFIRNNFEILTQTLDSGVLSKNDNSYMKLNSLASIRLLKNLELKGGIEFSKDENESYFYPQLFANYKIAKGAYISGQYSPHTNFITNKGLMNRNRFVENAKFINNTEEVKQNFSIKFSYEFYTSFNFYIEGLYNKTDNYLATDYINGIVKYFKANDVSESKLRMGSYLNAGKNGEFIAEFELNKSDLNGESIPGVPEMKFTGSYFVSIFPKVRMGLLMDYNSGITSNQKKLDPFVDLGINLDYKLNNSLQISLELSNLLDNENKLIYNYVSKSRDAIIGIKYNW